MRLRGLLVVSVLAAAPAAAQTAFISGEVIAAASSAPLAGITVASYGPKGLPETTTSTDTRGRYTLAVSFAVAMPRSP